jgi:hypothetical protein
MFANSNLQTQTCNSADPAYPDYAQQTKRQVHVQLRYGTHPHIGPLLSFWAAGC